MSGETNPWLSVPLAEYERHMGEALQLQALADLFGEALAVCLPRSVAVLGVAGGNGLDRIDSGVTSRVAGLDINGAYLALVAERFGDLPGLELHRADLASEDVSLPPVELVHAALVFEHAGVERCLENALALVAPGGHLSVVLQEPDGRDHRTGGRRCVSLGGVPLPFTLWEPERFCGRLGAEPVHRRRRAVPGGWFWHGIFRPDKRGRLS